MKKAIILLIGVCLAFGTVSAGEDCYAEAEIEFHTEVAYITVFLVNNSSSDVKVPKGSLGGSGISNLPVFVFSGDEVSYRFSPPYVRSHSTNHAMRPDYLKVPANGRIKYLKFSVSSDYVTPEFTEGHIDFAQDKSNGADPFRGVDSGFWRISRIIGLDKKSEPAATGQRR